jgi:hypothetical protein
MSETGDLSSGDITGDKRYQKRARAALPILVRQAKAGTTMLYGELAAELGMPNPRNLNFVLGAIGNSILQLGMQWGSKVPPIQALVVNKDTRLPGEGISWFAPDASLFKNASRAQRERIVTKMLTEVFLFRQWDDVLHAFGLQSLPPASHTIPSAEDVVRKGCSGEGEAHRRLKEAIAVHPEWLGLPKSLAPGRVEAPLRSGDWVDVVFSNGRRCVAVEVKPLNAPLGDLARGLFQCVKYSAVLEAESKVSQAQQDCRVILALGGALPAELAATRAVLGIEVRECLGDGQARRERSGNG